MRALLTTLCLLLATSTAMGKQHLIAKFDAKNRTTGELMAVIQAEARQGATVIRFPTGKWTWHDLTKLPLEPKSDEDLAQTQLQGADTSLENSVKDWISKHKVKAVQIGVAKDLPAEIFFRLENLLANMKVPYAVLSGGCREGRIRLIESDGRLRTLVPQNLGDLPEEPSEPEENQAAPPHKSGTPPGDQPLFRAFSAA